MISILIFIVGVLVAATGIWLKETREYNRAWDGRGPGRYRHNKPETWGFNLFVCLLVGTVAWFVIMIPIGGLRERNSDHFYKEAWTRDLVSAGTDSQIEGRLSILSGFINEESYYMYFYDTPQGIRQAKVRADDAVIVEQSEVKPALVKLVDTVAMLDLWTPRFPRSDKYEFIVPPGSVDRSISFNISDGE